MPSVREKGGDEDEDNRQQAHPKAPSQHKFQEKLRLYKVPDWRLSEGRQYQQS